MKSAMNGWTTLAEAIPLSGLRIALVRAGVPSPWSELCRAMFRVKGLAFVQVDGRDRETGMALLKSVSGQESLPVVFWNDERPRANWLEQLSLADRLGESPALLPQRSRARADVIGLCAELCAENGFGWSRRLMFVHDLLTRPELGERDRRIGDYLATRYGYTADRVPAARERCEEIVATFAVLDRTPFLAGETLSALDLAWAAFAALIRPLPPELCAMSELWRSIFTWQPKATAPEAVERLLQRRDATYRDYFQLPVVLT